MTAPSVQAALQAAIAHQQAGRLPEAERLYREILAVQPRHADALHFLGLLAHQSGRSDVAVELIGQALKVAPAHAPMHINVGIALQALGRLDEAAASYRQALALAPDMPEANCNLALVLLDQGLPEPALGFLDRALAARPPFPEALNNRGMALEALGRPAEALDSLDAALVLWPDYVEAHVNRGNALHALGRTGEAIAAYERALALRPEHADAHNNLGQALEAAGRTGEALTRYRTAARLRPDFAAARWNEGIALLRTGNYAEGWPLYEWRHQALGGRAMGTRALVRKFAEPLWLGDPAIGGQTLLVHHEQGLGDSLQMLRYVPLLAGRGARVIIEVPAALTSVAATVAGAAAVVAEGEPLPPFDLQCPLMSLPLACGTTTLDDIPASVPYLSAPAAASAAWQARLGPRSASPARQRIGLVWSGSTGHRNDRHRSLTLRQLLPLLSAPAGFHSLHQEYRPVDLPTLAATPALRDWSAHLVTFADTAGLIGQLDLVITVDTAVAHLAGAMARPVWLLLPFAADYRWLEGRTDSPWYPTMRLFRQPASGDWASVIAAIEARLRE